MTGEQTALLRKAKASLQAARMLAEKNFHDFAVARSYYSMFYLAEAFLLGGGFAFSKHSSVIAAFGRELVKPGRVPPEFHRYLIEGKDNRNIGDYDIQSKLSKKDSDEQIRRVEKFLELAERMIGPVPD
ncbi:MAG: HEPN domain-containing protein [Nitrospinae bacterium]|nr:HEPN domain-containing protein [Nitrospinota bacterium]